MGRRRAAGRVRRAPESAYRRVRAAGYRALETSPGLYCATVERRVATINLARPGVHLVVEGFQRSGNSYAREAIRLANPGIHVASHAHRAAHVLHAIALGIPTLVIVRDPDDAVCSSLLYDEHTSVDAALRGYRRFYARLWPLQDNFVVASFGQVTGDLGAVIERLNAKFGTTLATFVNSPASDEAVFAILEQAATVGGSVNELTVCRPSAVRAALAKQTRATMGEANPRLRADCLAMAERFMQLAGAKRRMVVDATTGPGGPGPVAA
jgi:hypothetical protein